MISFINPEEQTPIPPPTKISFAALDKELSANAEFSIQPLAAKLHKAHLNHTTKVIEKALIAKFGEMPSLDKIARHCRCFYDTQNVAHYVWCDSEPKLGDKIDLSDVLCVIRPPKFGPFGSP